MKDFENAPSGEFERALWRSAERERAPHEALLRTARALGVSGVLAATTVAAAESGAAALASNAPKATWILLAKPILVGLVGGVLTSWGVETAWLRGQERAAASDTHVASATATHVASALAQAPETPIAEPPSSLVSGPRAVAEPQRVPPSARSPVRSALIVDSTRPAIPSVASSSLALASSSSSAFSKATAAPMPPATTDPVSIAAQVAVMDRIRQTLGAGAARQALTELAEYRARWPSGVFVTDAAVLEIESHLALGDHEAATRLAKAFVATQPSNRYIRRVQSLFKSGELE